jgi:hypothetical protein
MTINAPARVERRPTSQARARDLNGEWKQL